MTQKSYPPPPPFSFTIYFYLSSSGWILKLENKTKVSIQYQHQLLTSGRYRCQHLCLFWCIMYLLLCGHRRQKQINYWGFFFFRLGFWQKSLSRYVLTFLSPYAHYIRLLFLIWRWWLLFSNGYILKNCSEKVNAQEVVIRLCHRLQHKVSERFAVTMELCHRFPAEAWILQ